MGARYYDPALGRFVQADTIVPNPGNPQSLNRYSYVYNRPLVYVDDSGHIPIIPIIVSIVVIGSKVVDYAWTAWDVYQSGKVLSEPNASNTDRMLAELNIALSVGLEVIEPDEVLPVGVPADDVVRKGAVSAVRKALKEGAEGALDDLPDWLRPIVRGLVTEDLILEQLGRQGQKRLVEGVVDGKVVKTIPDFIDDAGRVVGEIKDVAKLGWKSQIRAQYDWATSNGYTYVLYIRQNTDLMGYLKELYEKKLIQIEYIENILP